MEAISKLSTPKIFTILDPTIKAFYPLLRARKEAIFAVPKLSHSYGPNPRQELDVFEAAHDDKNAAPILVFFHGGGFVRGGKDVEYIPDHLAYHNLGAFFAERGYTTIIANYRRVNEPEYGTGEDATFPSGGDDVSAVLSWIEETYLASSQNQRKLFLMGNSAGGIHVTTFLFYHKYTAQRQRLVKGSERCHLVGVVDQSTPFRWGVPEISFRKATLDRYYPQALAEDSTHSAIEQFSLLGLFKTLIASHKGGPPAFKDLDLPPILILNAEWEPEDEIVDGFHVFVREWDNAFSTNLRSQKTDATVDTDHYAGHGLEVRRMPKHNHISPPVALMSGEGEEWAEDLVLWMMTISS